MSKTQQKHIVIFTGGELPNKNKALAFLKNTDFCIAADSGLIGAEQFGFLPHLIIGDFDSLAEQNKNGLLQKYSEHKIHRYSQDKDYSDTELAFFAAQELIQKNNWTNAKITLVGGSGGRIDHFFAIYELLSHSFYPHVWLCGNQIMYCIDSKSTVQKELVFSHFTQKDFISVFAVKKTLGTVKTFEKRKIVSTGLAWKLDDVDWESGKFSLSNKITAEFENSKKDILIKAQSGRFLVILAI